MSIKKRDYGNVQTLKSKEGTYLDYELEHEIDKQS